MNDENKGLFIIVAGGLTFLSLLIGSIMLGQYMKNECVKMVKDKPAVEIQAICK